MLATGAPLRNWTFLLLLCSSSTLASANTAANETVTTKSSATGAYPGATTHHTSHATSVPLPSPSPLSTRRYSDSESTSPYRTINYITHTLPQQCAKTSWSAPGETAVVDGTAVEAGALAGLQTAIPGIWEGPDSIAKDERRNANSEASSQPDATGSAPSATPSGTEGVQPELELEVDSPFDNANFLSFEEWKKKNLAKVGQSPENVGQGRPAASNQAPRRRPVNVNALDSLGDEGEISIDFSGFGRPEDGGVASSVQQAKQNAEATKAGNGPGKVAPGSFALSKDAGKTCKERFNYASFDCAATVLKTNKQAKSSSAILVENKDSYMLNICSADNKFLIVELCDDILVDTVVLANYEFFSSMFRHFRVSVSDRYPVKMEKWRTLGTFEARNSRDIQPFLITEPQIWARYLRIEFLTQFGNEYYCPLSLLRVHGTTMLEQFRQEEEEARGIDDEEDLEAEGVDVKKPAADSGPLSPEEIPIEALKDDGAKSVVSQTVDNNNNHESTPESHVETGTTSSSEINDSSAVTSEQPAGQATDTSKTQQVPEQSPTSSPTPTGNSRDSNLSATGESKAPTAPSTTDKAEVSPPTQGSVTGSPVANVSPPNDNAATASTEPSASASPSSSVKTSSNGTVIPSQPQSPGRGSATQPNAPTPSTQESFFKSIHKRLQYLEANSTLSLQYIEEQSRALRDAFIKTEKRQLAKTEKFLDHLNSTVMIELKSFRNMYDQLWQSTVIELESMKERQKSEMGEISTRLSLLADELVWQKRMAVVQSTLLLLCLGLVLFVRSGTLGSSADVPIVHQLGSKYTSFFETSPSRSPPNTSGMARRRSTLRNMWRSDTSAGLSDHHSDSRHAISDAETDGLRSPMQDECPDTPIIRRGSSSSPRLDSRDTTPVRHHHHHHQENLSPMQTPDDQAVRIQVLATQSGPATPNGTRDSRPSWEEVDRAMDLLKAEEQNQSPPSPSSPNSRHKDRGGKKKKRSPLRRAHSNFEIVGEEGTEGK